MNLEMQRGLGIATLKARADCCASCRILVDIRNMMADELEATPLVPTPPPAAVDLDRVFEEAGFTPAHA